MNEKFLSRGKSEDNGEWVKGYLIEQDNPEYHVYICMSGFKAEVDNRHQDILECDLEEIIPETAGRCVGLNDKNDVLFFEGDIVKAYLNNETEFTEKIEFRNGCFWFGNWNFIEFLDKFRNYEIIGNIHDNKQMLSRADMPVSNDVFQPVLQPATPENFEIAPA